MAADLTPWEKWQKEKARLAAGEVQNDAPLNPALVDNSSVYKKPGEYCSHPEDLCAVMSGYKVCGACGQVIAEGVAKSAEEREEAEFVRQVSTGTQGAADVPHVRLDLDKEDSDVDSDGVDEEEGYVK